MPFNSGFDEHASKKDLPLVSSGDGMLDELLEGGFQKDLIYLLIGDRKPTSKVPTVDRHNCPAKHVFRDQARWWKFAVPFRARAGINRTDRKNGAIFTNSTSFTT